MADRESRKILVKRPTRVSTDGHGRSVWADPVESAELELVSTQMLKVMLTSKNKDDRDSIEAAAAGSDDGVLVRHPGSGSFEIISDEELEEILAANDDLPEISKPADATLGPLKDYVDDQHLSLVSTQALRRVLEDSSESAAEDENKLFESGGGFNPYDNS
jgi:hypothetical protein